MKRCAFVVLAAVLLLPAVSSEAGVAYNGGRGLIRTRSADTIGHGILNFQLSANYFNYPDSTLIPGQFPGITNPAIVDYHFLITRATLTYGLNDYAELGANLDIRNWMRVIDNNGGNSGLDTYTRGGIGDLDIVGKVAFPVGTSKARLGAFGAVTLPTGNKDRGFSIDTTDFLLLGLATFDFTDLDAFVPTRLHVNAGYRWATNEDLGYGIFRANYPDLTGFQPPAYPLTPAGEKKSFNDIFHFNTAVEFPAPQVTFFVEFDWQKLTGTDVEKLRVPMALDSSKSYSTSSYTLTPGVALRFSSGIELKGAGDFNLNSADTPSLMSPPDWGIWLALAWTGAIIPQDRDDDGIADAQDACPDDPEDLDGFKDSDGCPDADNDGDGVADAEDQCPDLAEDFDGYQDGDGCPDLDNDQDGIQDAQDRCPNEPEDFDGDQDEDGCPDLVKDSDTDGVPDDLDRCPLQAEDVDGFQDEDGCPDLDNDLDGIPDTEDQCPNAPETFNGHMDEDGCPDERPIGDRFILQGVNFESGSAALTPDSYPILEEVARSLMAYPEVRVEIQGFTDSVGKASYNLGLSQRRADSVRQYLINAGIEPSRLVARGFGEADPVASNATPEGRAQNRRIEFKRLN